METNSSVIETPRCADLFCWRAARQPAENTFACHGGCRKTGSLDGAQHNPGIAAMAVHAPALAVVRTQIGDHFEHIR
jgi:hypothetical protein